MLHGTYIGENHLLKGEAAIIRQVNASALVLAQFDNLSLPFYYTHGWVCFHADMFKLDEEYNNEAS